MKGGFKNFFFSKIWAVSMAYKNQVALYHMMISKPKLTTFSLMGERLALYVRRLFSAAESENLRETKAP